MELALIGIDVDTFGVDGSLATIGDEGIPRYACECFNGEFYREPDAEVGEVMATGDGVTASYWHCDNGAIIERFDHVLAATGRASNVEHGSGLFAGDPDAERSSFSEVPLIRVAHSSALVAKYFKMAAVFHHSHFSGSAGAESPMSLPEHVSPMDEINRKSKLEFNKLQKRLRRNVGNAIVDYNMIEDGDVVMACISGGKDSYSMLDILLNLQKTAPVRFEVIAVNLDQKQPGFPVEVLPNYFESIGVPYYILDKDTYSVVKEKVPEGKTTCGLCSRLRRGTLYAFAESIGATRIALGHHLDDIVETLFLNMFYGSKLKAMPPKLLSDDRRNVVIRPLAYCRERDLEAFAAHKGFPIIPCNLCGSQENLQRQAIKAMLQEWDRSQPGRVENIFKALQNVSPSQLADTALFDFTSLALDRSGERRPYEFTDATVSSSGEGGVQLVNVINL